MDAGSVSVMSAQCKAEGEGEGGRCENWYAGIVNGVTSSTRCEVAARLATHVSAFAGATAECSRVR